MICQGLAQDPGAPHCPTPGASGRRHRRRRRSGCHGARWGNRTDWCWQRDGYGLSRATGYNHAGYHGTHSKAPCLALLLS
eukprot:9804387-Heterocapsa_arctica.AAC.1